jgi:hypothetical protein
MFLRETLAAGVNAIGLTENGCSRGRDVFICAGRAAVGPESAAEDACGLLKQPDNQKTPSLCS